MLYAVYDFTADVWSLLGDYPTLQDAQRFYADLLATPFYRERLCALYEVGFFDSETGEIVAAGKKVRIEFPVPVAGGVPGGAAPPAVEKGVPGDISPAEQEGVPGDSSPIKESVWTTFKNRFFTLR